jgi:Ca2+-binding RTX toxin-like protein
LGKAEHAWGLHGWLAVGLKLEFDIVPGESLRRQFLVMSGTGFTCDVNNRPTAGAVAAIQVTSGACQPLLQITDATVSASHLIDWITATDSYSFFSTDLAGNDTVNGSVGNNAVYGFGGNDTIFGGSGGDYLVGGTSNGTIDGGSDMDHVSYRNSNIDGGPSASGATVILQTGTASDGMSRIDTAISIEAVESSTFGDTIIVSITAHGWIFARSGHDEIFGGTGQDFSGNHTINAGTGSDTATYFRLGGRGHGQSGGWHGDGRSVDRQRHADLGGVGAWHDVRRRDDRRRVQQQPERGATKWPSIKAGLLGCP